MKKETVGVTSNDKTEITLGVCDGYNNYVPFVRLRDRKNSRTFRCLSCKHEYIQLVNGKIQFMYIDEIYKLAE